MSSQRSEQANKDQRSRIIEFMWENPDMVSKNFQIRSHLIYSIKNGPNLKKN